MADWFDSNGITTPQAQKQTTPPTSSSQGDWFDKNGITSSPNIAHPENLSIQPNPETATLQDRFRHYVGRFIPGLMSMVGGGIGEAAVPESFGASAAAGAGAGSLAGQGLQKLSPRTFGAPPPNLSSSVVQTGEDVLGNAVLPKVAGGVLRNIPAIKNALAGDVIEGATKKLDRSLYPQAGTIEVAAQNAQDHYDMNPDSTLYHGGTIGNQLLKIPFEQTDAKINSLKDINKTFMSDVTQVRNLKMIPGGVQSAEQLGINNLLQKGFTPSNGNINPDTIIKELDGKNADIYSEALRPQTKQNIVDLMNSVSKAQDTQGAGNNLIGFVKHRLIFYGAGAIAAGSLGHEELGAGAIVLTDAALSALMKNDTIAKAVIYASKTPQGSPASQVLQHVIMNGLKGSGAYVLANGPEDKLEKAYVDDKGQLTYSRPPQ